MFDKLYEKLLFIVPIAGALAGINLWRYCRHCFPDVHSLVFAFVGGGLCAGLGAAVAELAFVMFAWCIARCFRKKP